MSAFLLFCSGIEIWNMLTVLSSLSRFNDEKQQTGGLNLMPCWLSANFHFWNFSEMHNSHSIAALFFSSFPYLTFVCSDLKWPNSAMMKCLVYVWTYEVCLLIWNAYSEQKRNLVVLTIWVWPNSFLPPFFTYDV